MPFPKCQKQNPESSSERRRHGQQPETRQGGRGQAKAGGWAVLWGQLSAPGVAPAARRARGAGGEGRFPLTAL